MTVGELKIKLGADTSAFDSGMDRAQQALNNMESGSGFSAKNVSKIAGNIADKIKAQSPMMAEAGKMLFASIDDEVPAVLDEILQSAGYIMDAVTSAFMGYNGDMVSVGSSLVLGIAQGISSSEGVLLERIQSLGDTVLSEIETVFEIASPSKKTAYLGEMIGEGLASGIAGSLGKVQFAADGLYTAASSGAPNVSSTYNSYHTTYNASPNNSSAVNMADFENRIRRAYA